MTFGATSINAGTLLIAVLVIGLVIYGVAFIAARGAKRGSRE